MASETSFSHNKRAKSVANQKGPVAASIRRFIGWSSQSRVVPGVTGEAPRRRSQSEMVRSKHCCPSDGADRISDDAPFVRRSWPSVISPLEQVSADRVGDRWVADWWRPGLRVSGNGLECPCVGYSETWVSPAHCILLCLYCPCLGRCGLGCLGLSWFHGLHGRKGLIVWFFSWDTVFSYALQWVGLDPPGMHRFVVGMDSRGSRMVDVVFCRCIVRTVGSKVWGENFCL